ncbi:hypothetical protein [Aeromicrobium sp. Leaf272]|uniref:hypothetical protein n=1 Tax=Aeromicrobium sp. Leaf272 TaxID=1736317 RepID=UPI0007125466|nr:hypothetical protein [Aeromicrobium sp. Leaf272]KQP26710.1 hypothetical protein ASF38_06705 [Aeromicrobium sp. Leaf272]
MTAMDLREVTDRTSWRDPSPPSLPPVEVPTCTHPPDAEIGAGRVDLFGIDHDDVARFHRTSRGLTHAYTAGRPHDGAVLRHVPMGYTQLYDHEKVAVVLDGRVLRLWAARGTVQAFDLVVPPSSGQDLLVLGASHPVRYAVGEACNLSARLPGVPVMVARRLAEHGWH